MKFEDQLKEKLEERQLQPSANAWDKLSGQLDEHNAKSNKKMYWWAGMAASFVGVILLVTFLNKETATITSEPTIVDIEEVTTPISDEANSLIEVADQNIPEKEKTGVKSKTKKENRANQPILKQQLKKEQQKLIPNKIEEGIAETIIVKSPEEKPEQPLSFEEQKAKEVVAQIRALQQQKEAVTDAEIDALLNAAQKEIELKNLYDEATNKVDANALLQSVEDDLERSFRTRVFEMLHSGYKELKTAVAERNN